MVERRSLRSHTFCTSCFLSAAVWGLALISATSAFAQYNAVGDEILVATLDSPSKFWEKQVAASHGGGFVVAANVHIHAVENRFFQWGRQYSSSGFPIGDPFDISEIDLDSYDGNLSLDMAPGGAFVAAWTNTDVWPHIRVRRFSALASPLGPEIGVENAWDSRVPIAMADSGAFVVVWESESSPGSDDSQTSVQMRRYSSACLPLGNQLQVNTFVNGHQRDPDIAVGPNGSSVVVWESYGSPGDDQHGYSIQARRYGASGQAVGEQYQVNISTVGDQFDPAVSGNPDARFVVVWEHEEESLMARPLVGPTFIFSDGFDTGDFFSWSFVQQ